MANTESEVGNGTVSYPPNDVERVIYVMPRDPLSAPGMDDVDLAAIWRLLWRKRWVIVWVTAAFAAASVAYALLA
ncbi:MAG: Wzz/FepE/Etk N-terminal domain-containing protein, partial [Gammaproteobacteria bacterium]